MLEARIVAAKTHGLTLAAQFAAAAVARIAASSQGCALELIIGSGPALGRFLALPGRAAPLYRKPVWPYYTHLHDHDERPHPQDRRIGFRPDLRADSERSPRADQTPHSGFARLRHLWRQPRMVPHPARHARSARCDAHDLDLGHRTKTVLAARGAAQRHPGARF